MYVFTSLVETKEFGREGSSSLDSDSGLEISLSLSALFAVSLSMCILLVSFSLRCLANLAVARYIDRQVDRTPLSYHRFTASREVFLRKADNRRSIYLAMLCGGESLCSCMVFDRQEKNLKRNAKKRRS